MRILNKLLCSAAVDRRGSVVEKKEDTQADGGLPWMMKEDQEYTEMEPGALLSGENEHGGCSLYSRKIRKIQDPVRQVVYTG